MEQISMKLAGSERWMFMYSWLIFEVSLMQPTELKMYKSGFNPNSLTDIVLIFGVAVAESHTQHKLQATTDHERSHKVTQNVVLKV